MFFVMTPSVYSISNNASKLAFLNSRYKLEYLGEIFLEYQGLSQTNESNLCCWASAFYQCFPGDSNMQTGLRPSDLSHKQCSHFLLPMTGLETAPAQGILMRCEEMLYMWAHDSGKNLLASKKWSWGK